MQSAAGSGCVLKRIKALTRWTNEMGKPVKLEKIENDSARFQTYSAYLGGREQGGGEGKKRRRGKQ